MTKPLTPLEAEQRLLSLELFGMRFGLDRMRRLMTALDHPERAFRSVHVVGTNGKSSTARMLAAILTRHGHPTGAYLSPHLSSFCERIRVGDADVAPDRFAAAIERALRAADQVNRGAAEGDVVTQFELLTAAAYSELAARGVEFAVIEAGLGGRYDATNVISSEVQVLTSVGLDHTRWLGSEIADIAREKLDVVQPGAVLVLGPGMHPNAESVAEQIAAERGATMIRAGADPGVPVAALGAFQRRNFAVALAAAEALLGALDPTAVAAAAAAVTIPGRMQVTDERPLTVLDGAHNPDGIAALVEALPEVVHDRQSGRGRLDPRRQGCRDDASRARGRARERRRPRPDRGRQPALAVAGQAPSARRWAGRAARHHRDVRRAIPGAASGPCARRRGRGRRRHRLSVSRRRPAGARGPVHRSARIDAVNEDEQENHPRFLTIVGIVALSVAVTILIFFGVGYAFGRLFL